MVRKSPRTGNYNNPEIKELTRTRQEAADFAQPVLEARYYVMYHRQSTEGTKRPEDAMQWLLDEHAAQGNELTADELVQNMFITMVVSIHSTAMLSLSVIFDLLDHPETLQEIREEIDRVKNEHVLCTGTWTRRALDSFMRENLRGQSFNEVSVHRMAVVSFTFEYGLRIPAGTQVAFSSQQQNLDPDYYHNPEEFDPKRWLKQREEIDLNRFHFLSTTDNWLN